MKFGQLALMKTQKEYKCGLKGCEFIIATGTLYPTLIIRTDKTTFGKRFHDDCLITYMYGSRLTHRETILKKYAEMRRDTPGARSLRDLDRDLYRQRRNLTVYLHRARRDLVIALTLKDKVRIELAAYAFGTRLIEISDPKFGFTYKVVFGEKLNQLLDEYIDPVIAKDVDDIKASKDPKRIGEWIIKALCEDQVE